MRKVIVNFSGGKDSTVAILEAMKKYPKEEIVLCWQDTGGEYLETEGHVKRISEMLELPLVILRRDELFWEMVQRFGVFPTPQGRGCTRKLKKDAFRMWVRANRASLGEEIIVVSGIRADESYSRYGMDPWCILPDITLKNGSFKAFGWLPCFNMSKNEVMERVKSEGLPLHPCYEFSTRCSCWMCIFQPNSVVRTYAEMQPDLYKQACLVEDEIKHKWKDGFGFNDLMRQGRLL